MAEEPVELGYYGAVLGRNAGLVALVALLTGILAAVALGSSSYQATSEVLIRPINTASSSEIQSERTINTGTERQIATSVNVAELVAADLGVENPRALLKDLRVTVPVDTQVLVFEFNAATASEARAGAQAFAESYLEYRTATAELGRQDQIERLQGNLDARTAELVEVNLVINRAGDEDTENDPTPLEYAQAQSRRELLLDEVSVINDELGAWQGLRVDAGEVIAPAQEPSSPSQRSRLVLFVLGLGVGTILGAGLAFVLDRLRARVNNVEDLADELDAPVLAAIPAAARASQMLVTLTEPHSPAAHAYRRLAVALTADPDREPRWVLLVGATGKEPRTAVALNLAVALLQQGRQVLLVSGDRHNPQIDRTFDLGGQPGFDEHLAGAATSEPQEVLRGLHVLPAGTGQAFPVHHMPPQQAVAAVLERGRRIADIVLVDAPPALDYSDAEAIGPLVDAVIVVASAEQTSRREIAEVRTRMDLVQAPVRGAVLVHRPSLRQRLSVLLRERTPDRRAVAGVGQQRPAGGRATSGWGDERAASTRSSEDLATDAAALKARIESLLKRHTPTGLTPRLPPGPYEPQNGGAGATPDADEPAAGRSRR
jgi:Mrp family chromosome partitioning ATPase